ncbi:serine/threonine-protein phosphatase 2A 65 kDa regulatory subunit A alpha isoform-like [Schistocerca gregaria]|uniref:serine/threonine-protein phosphatase 2A 65 kDa regulatory subunit A alpha isoform-like n=1 Tax=Schistocerca gregaria TaxID=7010 RepID=UPI00211DB2FC|nr:serine/threonine-protein phosphatase 2A 65 kDa regulatory subunit A alpha isoform-like [Schistocerca gregaria]
MRWLEEDTGNDENDEFDPEESDTNEDDQLMESDHDTVTEQSAGEYGNDSEYLGELFHRLCEDEDMIVRRLALSMLPAIAEDADVQFYASHVVPIFEKALEDKIGLHLEATQALIALFKSKKLSDDVHRHLLPVLYKYAEDPYWQVRFLIANSINDMFRSLFRSLLCRKGGCCLWVFLRRRQPFYEDDDDEMVCDPGMNIAMSHWCGASLPEEAPTWYECTLGEVYEHKSTPSYGADLTHPDYRDTIANIEKRMAEEKKYLGELFHRLCEDEDMLVRRLALSMLPAIAEDADVQFYASHVVPIFEKALEDKIGLHLEATQALIALFKSKKLSDDVHRHLLPVLYKYAEDPYWHVRFLIANSINDIHNSVNSLTLKSSCFSLMLEFSTDPETRGKGSPEESFNKNCVILSGFLLLFKDVAEQHPVDLMSDPKKKRVDVSSDPEVWLRWLEEDAEKDENDVFDSEESDSNEDDQLMESDHDTVTEQSAGEYGNESDVSELVPEFAVQERRTLPLGVPQA